MLTACRFAIDEEYPTQLDTTGAPLGAALLDFLHHRVFLGIRRRWLLDRARRMSGTSPRFATASGEPCLMKSIAPMSTAMSAATARASALCVNLGLGVYEQAGGCEARRSVGSPPVINVSRAWKSTVYQHPHISGESEKLRANVPCRQIEHELDNSKSQGSTQAQWKTCLPSHGKTRTSSPSSKSTIQIGHVSRPIASGSGSSCAEESVVT
jgi:hypothetical protein